MSKQGEKGVLYIISTPIGNLKDITYRAIEVLSQVSLIAAEDTRHTQILLTHYQLPVATTSYHEYNKEKKTPWLIQKLKAGESIAVVSDAGTPGISDPCFHLIREALRESIEITTIPGATAFVPALILSGLPLNRFVFEGFLPVKKGRRSRLIELQQESRTIILYEAPHRLAKTLKELFEFLGDRSVAICKELTKVHEKVLRGRLSQVLENLNTVSIKGEWVIVIAGTSLKQSDAG